MTSKASVVLARALQWQEWPATVYIVLGALATYVLVSAVRRPSLHRYAPKLAAEGWPVVGSWAFWSERTEFLLRGAARAKSGQFSFWFGPHYVVGLSGLEGRKAFFETREMGMQEAYSIMLTSTPKVNLETGSGEAFSKFFARNLLAIMKKEKLSKTIDYMTQDTRARLALLTSSPSHGGNAKLPPGVMNPFENIYRIVYQLTMRTVGAHEIAEDAELCDKTLALFESIEAAGTATKILFPWMPSVGQMRQLAAGARLYMTLDGIVSKRRKDGVRRDDALQHLMDQDTGMVQMASFIIGSLFAGQLNSGVNAAWILVELAQNAEWLARVRAEVAAAVEKHRRDPAQTPADVLDTLDMDAWEAEFPDIDLCLRESIRFELTGCAFRKNVSDHPVVIGGAKNAGGGAEVVPPGALATYALDDLHFDPAIYTDPYTWDPSRFLPDRAEDKKVPLGYLGWGIGRHFCLGMRFAKLEICIITAYFVCLLDFQLCDRDGKPTTRKPRPTNRNRHSAKKPPQDVYLRYQLR